MIVDFHTHIFPPEIIAARERYAERDPWFAELYSNPRAKMADGDMLVASMDDDGVTSSVTFPFGWSDPGLIEDCNSYVIEVMRMHPGRVIGLAAAQPTARARAVAEVERCAQAGMPGIGELMPHGQGYRLSDTDVFEPLAEVARAYDLFVLTHTSEPVGHRYAGKGDVTPAELQAFLLAFPDLRIVASHWGGGYPFYELMPEVHQAASRVWYDSAASLYLYRPEIFTLVARIAGPEKILWASDYPLLGQRRMLDYVRASGLTEAELTLALGANAATLLGAARLGNSAAEGR